MSPQELEKLARTRVAELRPNLTLGETFVTTDQLAVIRVGKDDEPYQGVVLCIAPSFITLAAHDSSPTKPNTGNIEVIEVILGIGLIHFFDSDSQRTQSVAPKRRGTISNTSNEYFHSYQAGPDYPLILLATLTEGFNPELHEDMVNPNLP